MRYLDDDDLDNHHPSCKGPCGMLADECMCSWPKEYWANENAAPYVEEPEWVSDHWM